ncbi:hypothetical protein MILUP08_43397 [Micromonospora lupini str. Lupac 08]|uniref:Uncharacterized protein n=1 Tax=Micromonospora lupini str. Lupac 08 TaxID=1150864 RepID=I0L3U0_9ACTN|nr:hypothetical protein MILUP08_43397 [Micromonospora lupini str. Lupac 08]
MKSAARDGDSEARTVVGVCAGEEDWGVVTGSAVMSAKVRAPV